MPPRRRGSRSRWPTGWPRGRAYRSALATQVTETMARKSENIVGQTAQRPTWFTSMSSPRRRPSCDITTIASSRAARTASAQRGSSSNLQQTITPLITEQPVGDRVEQHAQAAVLAGHARGDPVQVVGPADDGVDDRRRGGAAVARVQGEHQEHRDEGEPHEADGVRDRPGLQRLAGERLRWPRPGAVDAQQPAGCEGRATLACVGCLPSTHLGSLIAESPIAAIQNTREAPIRCGRAGPNRSCGPISPRVRRAMRAVFVLLFAGLALHVSHAIFRFGGATVDDLIKNVDYDLLLVGSAGACLARAYVTPVERRAWGDPRGGTAPVGLRGRLVDLPLREPRQPALPGAERHRLAALLPGQLHGARPAGQVEDVPRSTAAYGWTGWWAR